MEVYFSIKMKQKKCMMLIIDDNSNTSNNNDDNKKMENSCIKPPPSLQVAKKVWKDAEGRMGLALLGRPGRRTVGAHQYQSCTDIY